MTKPGGKSEPGVLECARHSHDLTATFLEMARAFTQLTKLVEKTAVQRRASLSGVDSARSEHRERRRAHHGI
jgi:hypothetical protein